MTNTGSIQIPYIPQITERGTEVRKYNALNHGFWDNRIVITALGEKQADFEQLCDAMTVDLNPQGVIEQDLVHRLAGTRWQMKRAPRFEAAHITEQIIEVSSKFDQAMRELQEEREELLDTMRADEVIALKIEALETANPIVWDENDEIGQGDLWCMTSSQVDKDTSDELKKSTTLQQARDILKTKAGWHDDAILQCLKKSYQVLLEDDRKYLADVEERESRLREEHAIAIDRLCIPSSDVMNKIQRYLGPLERRFLKDLEVLLKMQAMRLGFKKLTDNQTRMDDHGTSQN